MARISTYQIDATISDGDKLIGTDVDNNKITKNFAITDISEFVIDKLIDPDSSDFLIPVFNQGGTRITGSIMSQDSSPSNGVAGTKITIAGNLEVNGTAQIDSLTSGFLPYVNPAGILADSIIYQDAEGHVGVGVAGTPPNPKHKFEVYDLRDENNALDYSMIVSADVTTSGLGAGGIKNQLSFDGGVTYPYAISLVTGTTSSEVMTTGRLAFFTNSDLNTTSATGFSGFATHDGTNPFWQLGGGVVDATPSTTLKVIGTGEFTDQLTIPETPIAGTDAASKSYVDTLVTGLLDFKGTFRADTGEILSGINSGFYLYNCPGGAGTRVAIDTGDYYIVSDAGGQFYCSGDSLQIGDSIVASSDAAADSSTLNDWGILEGDNVEGSGTENTIPLWTDSQFLDNSMLSQETGATYNTSKNLVVNGNIYQSNMGQSVSIGEGALENGASGVFSAENVAIGQNALNSLTIATNNIGIGANTLQNTNANNNIAIGKNSQIGQTIGLGNISLGFNSLSGNNVGNQNVVIGHTAVQNVGTGSQGIWNNVILGAGATNATTITNGMANSVVIGYNALEEANATNINDIIAIGENAAKFIEGNSINDIGIGFSAFYGNSNGFNSSGENIAIGAGANGSNSETANTRSIKIGSDSGTASSYAVNVSAVNTNNYDVNRAKGEHAAIIGGANNEIQNAEAAFTGGGRNNTIAAGATGGAILGGFDNTVNGGGSAGMALGSNLEVNGSNQVVLGRFNVGNNNSKLIVGAGFSNANKINALEVKNTSQLKLGKYGAGTFQQSGALYNVLVVSTTGNVNEVPVSNFNPQIIASTNYTANPGSVINIGGAGTRLVKISWGSTSNGTATLRLPAVANFANKTVQIITDGTFNAGAGKKVNIEPSFGTSVPIDGNASFELSKKYEGVTLWTDGTEWFIIQAKAH